MQMGCDDGSAVAEFALVSVLVCALALGVLQVGFALHVRNTLTSAAADGARYGALADRDPSDGAARTRQVITESLSSRWANDVSARMANVDGIETVEVTVRGTLPVLGVFGPAAGITVTAHAVAEQP
jgi:Flp pilus assembly protein TadG